MTKKPAILLYFYPILLILLFFYSYTQIDLNLTLSSLPFYQKVQQFLIQIGYFQRPLSSLFYLLIFLFLFSFYLLFLNKLSLKLSLKYFWRLMLVTAGILFLAYPLLSHDIFNYIFDSRILLQYKLNPWSYKALDFPNDLWTRFMHWTHRTYPYGPSWLLISVPFYFLGAGKFLTTFFSFKLMAVLFYILICFLYLKIQPKKELAKKSFIFFAFHPLILFDFLSSAHNDISMVFFALLSFYLLLKDKPVLSFFSFLLSAGIKYVAFIYLPVYFYYFWQKNSKKEIRIKEASLLYFFLSLIAVLFLSFYREFQTWYLIWPLSFAALIPQEKISKLFSYFAAFSLLIYLPFLYYGEWQMPIYNIKSLIIGLSLIMAIIIYLCERKFYLRKNK